MLKFYLQIFLVLSNAFGILACIAWLTLTFLYYKHGIDSGQALSLDYTQVSIGFMGLIVCSLGLFFSAKWYKKSKASALEKVEKYKELSGS